MAAAIVTTLRPASNSSNNNSNKRTGGTQRLRLVGSLFVGLALLGYTWLVRSLHDYSNSDLSSSKNGNGNIDLAFGAPDYHSVASVSAVAAKKKKNANTRDAKFNTVSSRNSGLQEEGKIATTTIDLDSVTKVSLEEKQKEPVDSSHSGDNKENEMDKEVADASGREGEEAEKEQSKGKVSDGDGATTATTTTTTTSGSSFFWKQPTEKDFKALQICFPANSKEWLQGPRHGNSRQQDALMDDSFVANMILFGQQQQHQDQGDPVATAAVTTTTANDLKHFRSETILQQSMCHNDSRFLNDTDSLTDDRSMELWVVRLTFMAMHRIQHQFAVPEAQQRATTTTMTTECQQLAQDYQIGQYDYECPHGKFLVVPIENLGLGAVMRTTVLSGLLAAMATNRTVLFINNAPVGPKPIQQAWFHASCDRLDVQCFFHTPTPCVLTHDQLKHAPVMNQFRNVTKLFRNPNEMKEESFFDQEQTIVLPLKTITRRVPNTIPKILRNFALEFHNSLGQDDPRRTVVQQVAQRFVSNVHHDKVDQLISYGLVLYAMRPHLESQTKLRSVLEQVVPPSSTKALPEVTLGLPIRASDKCLEESECFAFEKYMRVLVQIWNRNKASLTQAMKAASVDKLSIVLTTESAIVLEEKDEFMADAILVKKTVPFPFEYIVNEFDTQQDNGNPRNNIPEHNLDVELAENNADQVMLSMMSSLQLQLLARYSIGNCCSNFHRILFELLDGGCGAAYQSSPECLQTNEDPEFRICCIWDDSEECKAKNVRENIDTKWKAAKQKRMQERYRRNMERQGSMIKGE